MKKPKNFRNKRLLNNTTLAVALLIAATLVFGSVNGAMVTQNTTQPNINQEPQVPGVSNGRLPLLMDAVPSSVENPIMPDGFLGETAYACDIYPNFHSIWFDTDVPGTLNQIAPLTSYDFIAGGCWADGTWYGIEYNAYGPAPFWTIDETTGAMTQVGTATTTETLNGLAYDDNTGTMYTVSGTNLYTIDMTTGATTLVGAMGNTGGVMIGIACDNAGNLYGEDLGDDSLYLIDTATGAATVIGALGINLNYAQDMAYDKTNDILYLAALTIHAGNEGALYTCDVTTGVATYVGMLGTTLTEVAGFAIPYTSGPGPGHDVGVQSIVSPATGPAGVITPEVKVKNFGNNSETDVPVQLTISTINPPTTVWSYGFEDWVVEGFTHPGWTAELLVGTDPDCYWQGHDEFHYIYPDADPYAGTVCALLDTGMITNYGECRAWYNTPFDFQSWGSPMITLNGMFHKRSYGGSTQGGEIGIELSTDGVTWTNVGTIDMYDATDPGWVPDSADLSAFANEPVVYLGFHGIDGGYSDILMDEITIETSSVTTEYDQTVLVDVPIGETVSAIFPDWTPADWQVTSNADITYILEACQLMTDDNPANDCKMGTATLHFPYVHDVEVVSIDAPTAGGPAQTQDMKVTIKNSGQYPECCFKTKMQVETILGSTVVFTEDFSVNYWTASHSNWAKYYNNYAGGTSPEYRFYWSPSSTADFYLTSDPIDTSGYAAGEISFKHYVNDYNGDYDLYFKTSPDGVTWYDAWTVPGGSYGPETVEFSVGSAEGFGSSTFQMAFVFSGNSFNINYWYVDDVQIEAVTSTLVEYYEEFCVPSGTFLEPGEELEIDFDPWTPDALGLGVSGEIEYVISAWTDLDIDDNPANDLAGLSIVLDYYHDVLIKDITAPMDAPGDILWSFDAETACAETQCLGVEVDDDDNVWVTGGNSGADPNKLYKLDLDGNLLATYDQSSSAGWGWRDLAWDGDFLYGSDSTNVVQIDPATGLATGVTIPGPQNPCRALAYDPATDHFWTSSFSGNIDEFDRTGAVINSFTDPYGGTYGMAWDDYSDDGPWLWIYDQYGDGSGDVLQFDPVAGTFTGVSYQGIQYGSGIAGGAALFDKDGLAQFVGMVQGTPDEVFALEICETGPPGAPDPDIFIQPGTEAIEAVVENNGVFGESGMNVRAQIYEYITNATVGTLVYDENYTTGALDPLGGLETATFPSYTFPDIAGVYRLEFMVTLAIDDFPDNNEEVLGIGVDNEAPTSSHAIDPAAPNGANGWYISDATVTLDGDDGTENWQSGVDHFEYRIDGGAWQTGDTFVINTNGMHTIDYKAVDGVGNEETPNSFDVNMDQDGPTIDLTWEAAGGLSKDIIFTATCSDADSGMDYVEFYLNDVLQNTDDSDPYEWIMTYAPGTKFTVKAIAYDLAGNTDFDTLESSEGLSVNVYTSPTPLTK